MRRYVLLVCYSSATLVLLVAAADQAQARPSYGADCLECHSITTGRMEMTAFDKLVDLGQGELKTYEVAPGATVPLTVDVTDGHSTYAVAMVGLDGGGVQNPSNHLDYTADPDWVDRTTSSPPYYTSVSSRTTWVGPLEQWVFDLTVNPATPADYYLLEMTVAGRNGGRWGQTEQFYLEVLAALPELVTNPVTGGTLQFGNVLVGQSVGATLSASNAGPAGTSLSGDFPAATGPFGPGSPMSFGPLGPGQSADRVCTYAPTTRGLDSQQVTVTSNGGDSVITLSGTGVAPVRSVDTSLADAGLVRIGTSGSVRLTVGNSGDGNLSGLGTPSNLNGTVPSAAGSFSGLGGDFSLADGANQAFDFTFAPGSHGVDSRIVPIDFANGSADGTNSPQTVNAPLSGTGVGPVFSSSAAPGSTLDFGGLLAGRSSMLALNLANITDDANGGDAALTDLTVLSATIEGPDAGWFSIPTFTTPSVLPKADNVDLLIDFTPLGAPGTRNATLNILTDQGAQLGGAGSSFVFDLAGTVDVPPMNLDVDDSGTADALTDGVLILRYLFGFSGQSLVDGVLDPDAGRTNPSDIALYLEAGRDNVLDVDGSGTADALTDGVLILRYLFGFTDQALVEDALDPEASRTDPDDILAFLDSYLPTGAMGMGLQPSAADGGAALAMAGLAPSGTAVAVPEPATGLMAGLALLALVGWGWRRRKPAA